MRLAKDYINVSHSYYPAHKNMQVKTRKAICILLVFLMLHSYVPVHAFAVVDRVHNDTGYRVDDYYQFVYDSYLISAVGPEQYWWLQYLANDSMWGFVHISEDLNSNQAFQFVLDAEERITSFSFSDIYKYFFGEDPRQEDIVEYYVTALSSLMMTLEANLDDVRNEQARADATMGWEDYLAKGEQLAFSSMAYIAEGSVFETAFSTCGISVDIIADSLSSFEQAEFLAKNANKYLAYHNLLQIIIDSTNDVNLKKAATCLKTATDKCFEYYTEHLVSNYSGTAANAMSSYYFDVLDKVLENARIDGSFRPEEIKALGGLCNAAKAVGSFKLGVDIGKFVGDVLLKSSDTILRYYEIAVMSEVREALINEIYKLNAQIKSPEDFEAIKDACELLEELLYVTLRGEYCVYMLKTQDVGLLSLVTMIGQWEFTEEWFDGLVSTISWLQTIINGIFPEWDSFAVEQIDRSEAHYYEVIENGIYSWEGAEQYCESLGGHLATITTQEENDHIYRLLTEGGYSSAYFGLTDSVEEGTWRWVTGEPVVYTNWHSSEPNRENSNEDYAMFYFKFKDGSWNDGDFGGRTVSAGTAFICEWDTYKAYESYLDSINLPEAKQPKPETYYQYLRILQDNKSVIKNTAVPESVSVIDITNNGIPELLYLSKWNEPSYPELYGFSLDIWSCSDSNEVTHIYSDPYFADWMQAQYLFQIEGQTTLYSFLDGGDMNFQSVLNEYSFDRDNAKLVIAHTLEKSEGFFDNANSRSVEELTFWGASADGLSISEEEYNNRLNEIREKECRVILSSGFTPKATSEYVAMTYEEAIAYLQDLANSSESHIENASPAETPTESSAAPARAVQEFSVESEGAGRPSQAFRLIRKLEYSYDSETPGEETIYRYDDAGALVSSKTSYPSIGAAIESTYTYDGLGRVSTVVFFDGGFDWVHRYEYDASGYLINESLFQGQYEEWHDTFQYSNGVLQQREHYSYSWKEYTSVYQYDGERISEEWLYYGDETSPSQKILYGYDEAANLIDQTRYYYDGRVLIRTVYEYETIQSDSFEIYNESEKENLIGASNEFNPDVNRASTAQIESELDSPARQKSEKELLSLVSSRAVGELKEYIYLDMDHDGTKELVSVFNDQSYVLHLWYCNSDGSDCFIVHDMEELDYSSLDILEAISETHVALNTGTMMGNNRHYVIIRLENKFPILISDQYGYVEHFGSVRMTESGEIAHTFESYDGLYDPKLQGFIVHTWKDTFLFFDGNTYKEYGALQISEEVYLQFQNALTIKNLIIAETTKTNTEYLEFSYFLRANGILHIQCNNHASNGEIEYGYYTVRYNGAELDPNLGVYNWGQMSESMSAFEAVYPKYLPIDNNYKDDTTASVTEATVQQATERIYADTVTTDQSPFISASSGADSLVATGCVFPDSSNRYLTDDEIAGLTDGGGYTRSELIRFAINELYARNHMSFGAADLNALYSSQSWYANYGYTDRQAWENMNEIERYNLDNLIRARKAMQEAGTYYIGDTNHAIPSATVPISSAKSVYGQALLDGNSYSVEEKVHIIANAYYDRKNESNEYRDGYTSRSNSNNSTGYRLGFYYGDGLVFYAEVIEGSSILVKLYYWNGELIGCRDYRYDGNLYYKGSGVLEGVASEFYNVYEIGMNSL